MPWQRHVLDVALEVDPATGLLAYREVVLTVPRQSGKTLLLLCLMVHRALGFGSRQRILYTAQTRNDARKKWEDEHVRTLEESPFASMFSVRYNNGNEAIRWNNGSMHALVAPTEKAAHGETLDIGAIDEAFAQVDGRLEQAMKPAMITRPQPQLWVVSTAGTDKSVYLRGQGRRRRARCSLGVTDSGGLLRVVRPERRRPVRPGHLGVVHAALGTRCLSGRSGPSSSRWTGRSSGGRS
jgi:Phage terminase-like protein, large subunit